MFRTSLSGFHKEDVNRYIAELSKKIEEVSARCQKAEQETDGLRGERDRRSRRASSSGRSWRRQTPGWSRCSRATTCSWRRRASTLRTRPGPAKEEDELRQRVAELEARIPELEQRAGRYEKEALSIAQTLIGAREESERIVAAARDNARLVQEQLRQEVARVAGALDRMTADYVEIREGTQRYGEQLRVMMQTLFDELELTKGHLSAIEITPIGQEQEEKDPDGAQE